MSIKIKEEEGLKILPLLHREKPAGWSRFKWVTELRMDFKETNF